jgi:sporulation protein YqfC
VPEKRVKTRKREKSDAKPPHSTVRRLGDAMGLPAEVLPDFSSLEMLGNREAIVQGVQGVLCCSACKVSLNLGHLIETFEGADLVIRSYLGEELRLGGQIAAVFFSTC